MKWFRIAQIVFVVLAGVFTFLPVPVTLPVGCAVLSFGCGIIVILDDEGIA